jgi:hypothetical protein
MVIMKKWADYFAAGTAVMLMILCQCSSTNSAKTVYIKTVNIEKLAFSNGEISGWNVDTTGTSESNPYSLFRASDSMEMFNRFDGGAIKYLHGAPGFSSFLMQNMVDSSKTLTVFIVDYTNSSNASTLFNVTKTSWFMTTTLAGFSTSIAISDTSHESDVWACAHFSRFYVELHFLGFSDRTESVSSAEVFLDTLKARID